jgi:drug/metabolite transporter (DMT)-like permease
MGATIYAIPALTVLMSWGILGEVPHWLTFAGGALCLAGVAIARRRGVPEVRTVPACASPYAVPTRGTTPGPPAA